MWLRWLKWHKINRVYPWWISRHKFPISELSFKVLASFTTDIPGVYMYRKVKLLTLKLQRAVIISLIQLGLGVQLRHHLRSRLSIFKKIKYADCGSVHLIKKYAFWSQCCVPGLMIQSVKYRSNSDCWQLIMWIMIKMVKVRWRWLAVCQNDDETYGHCRLLWHRNRS